ncbi:hypothetical protein K438DRAFT_1976703 [Mycena galopus ATCC 62051]|nr:hypothetical protein K438DRAFT_1976703 [Mycena galopus ATCC 62051]
MVRHAHLATELPAFSDFEFRKPSFDFEFSRPSFDFEFRKPSFDFAPSFDLTTPPVLREIFDAFRADVGAFLTELPSLSLPAAFDAFLADLPSLSTPSLPLLSLVGFPSAEDALVCADFGRRINYSDLPIDWRNNPWVITGYRYESLFTVFALLCLASSSLWHTMAGCAHKGAMEMCAHIDYVGIGWLIAVSIGTIVHHGYACVVPELAHVGGEKISTLLQPVLLHSGAGIGGIGGVAGVEALGVIARLKHALAGTVPMASFLFPFTTPLYVVARLLERGGTLLGMHSLKLSLEAVLASLTPWASSFVTPLASAFNAPWTSLTASLPSLAALESLTVALMSSAASWPAYHPVGAGCLLLCAAADVLGNVLPFCDWFNRVENRAFQSREHVLCECPLYEDQRQTLRAASKDLFLPELLGTKEGISALAKFLEQSGAFTKTGKPRREEPLPTLEEEPDPHMSDEEE